MQKMHHPACSVIPLGSRRRRFAEAWPADGLPVPAIHYAAGLYRRRLTAPRSD